MAYQSSLRPFSGSDYEELAKQARQVYHAIQKQTPRRHPYVRAPYFGKDKIFIETFWQHLNQKPERDRRRRLKFFACAIDLIANSMLSPVTTQNPNKSQECLYRFKGVTTDNWHYSVQIKENKRTGRKDFMSVFPIQGTRQK